MKLILNEFDNVDEQGKWFELPEHSEYSFLIKPITRKTYVKVVTTTLPSSLTKKHTKKSKLKILKRNGTLPKISCLTVCWDGKA